MDHPNAVNENELEWGEQPHREKFGYRRKSLGSSTGGEKLGCSLYEVPPGRRAWPYHYHLANEEDIDDLHGSGTLRTDERELSLSRGDYVALPVGESGAPDHKHLGRAAALPLLLDHDRTRRDVYPDSDKIGLFAGSAPGGPKEKRRSDSPQL